MRISDWSSDVCSSDLLAIVYFILETAVRSPWGRALRAVRDEENSAAMNGKHVASLRVQSFVLGAVVMGVGGALYASYIVTIDYSHFRSEEHTSELQSLMRTSYAVFSLKTQI